LHHAPE